MNIFVAIKNDDMNKIDEIITEHMCDEYVENFRTYSVLSYMLYLKKYELFKKYVNIINPDDKQRTVMDCLLYNYEVEQVLCALEYTKIISHNGEEDLLNSVIHAYLRDKDFLVAIERVLEMGANIYRINKSGFSATDLLISYRMDKLEPFKKYNIKYANISYMIFLIAERYCYDEIEIVANHLKDKNELFQGHTILWYEKHETDPNKDVIELFEEMGIESR